MAIYTAKEIQQFRNRWEGQGGLVNSILDILKGNGPISDRREIICRIRKANQLLRDHEIQHLTRPTKEIFLGNCGDRLQTLFTIPSMDLRGFPFREGEYLKGIVLCGAHLEGCYFESVILDEALFQYAEMDRIILAMCKVENSDFRKVNLRGAEIHWGTKLVNSNFYGANLEGAFIIDTHIEGSNFSFAKLGTVFLSVFENRLTDETKIIKAERVTTFRNCTYLPQWRNHICVKLDLKTLGKELSDFNKSDFPTEKIIWKDELDAKFFKHLFNRWFYTKFEQVRIDDADTTMAADLYRYIKDQQFIQRYKTKHPIIHFFWKLFSDCGGKLSIVGFWSIFWICAFALLYSFLPTETINFQPFFKQADKLPSFWQWIYVSFDIFSSLGIRNAYPQNWFGVVLMITESVLGLMMLGMLLSVLQNRFARRS
jgi:hypothetical protein